jgi:hypothetical protein
MRPDSIAGGKAGYPRIERRFGSPAARGTGRNRTRRGVEPARDAAVAAAQNFFLKPT